MFLLRPREPLRLRSHGPLCASAAQTTGVYGHGWFVSLRLGSIRLQHYAPQKYQLLLGTCLRIATLATNGHSLTRSNLAYSSDNSFGEVDVERTEVLVLEGISWQLAPPTMYTIASTFVAELPSPSDRLCLTIEYVLELALQTSVSSYYDSSTVAASALAIAARMCDEAPENAWQRQLESSTGYSLDLLQPCVNHILGDAERIRLTLPGLQMVSRKYRGMQAPFDAPVQLPLLLQLRRLSG